jgi:very-short-patch-repair endonuclease
MSSYPYVLYPALLLDFMAEQGEMCDFNVEDRVQIKEQSLKVADKPNSQHWWKQLYKLVGGFMTILVWTKVRHVLVLLPGIILLLGVIKGFLILGIFGDLGWLVLTTFGLGGGMLLWLIVHFQGSQPLDRNVNSPERLSNVQKKESLTLNSKSQKLHRLKQLKLRLSQKVRQSVGISDAPIGASERQFEAVLKQHFCYLRVQTQLKFPVIINGKEYVYSTDFAIIFNEIGLSIDVEIDEPYDYKSKKPTHCIDQPNDTIRNQYFIEGNWIVIRFSEAQIVLYPDSCCKTIAKVISSITGLKGFDKQFADIPNLKPTPMWTRRQALRMRKARVRELTSQRLRDRYLSCRNF